MAWIIARLLALFGPAVFYGKAYLPSLAAIKAVLIGVVAITVMAIGVVGGWWLKSWGDDLKIARAQAEAVAKANLEAKANALADAAGKQTATLKQREEDLAATMTVVEDLTRQLEMLRAQAHDDGAPFVSGDDPWLRDRPNLATRLRGTLK
jgi:hypothetical protein